MKKTTLLLVTIAGLFLLASCFDNTPREEASEYVSVIVNEGNFSQKNGSINYYSEETGRLNLQPLGMELGATYQSAAITSNGLLWVLGNNPDKLVTFDAISGRTDMEIPNTQLKNPRFMEFYETYLFVSNWGDPVANGEWSPGVPRYEYPNSYVAVLNAADNFTLTKKLTCGYDAEGMKIYKNRLFVATKAGVEVFDITQASMPNVATIATTAFSGNAKQFVVDSSENLWVSYTDGGLLGFDPATYAILHTLPQIKLDDFSGNIAITKDGKKIISYATTYDAQWNPAGAAIYATDLASGVQTEVLNGNYYLYGIGVSPFTGNIYTADTRFDANSELMIVDVDSNEIIARHTVGVGTSRFVFFAYRYYK